jgi:MazG family protein
MTRPFELPQPAELAAQTGESFAALVRLMQRLLAADGCPWDREQTPGSLARYVMEEASEVIDAIDSGDASAVCEELGDLSLQIAFLAELYRREAAFGPDDVMRAICEKLVRRHPHVFGSEQAADADAVATRWEHIKREEKQGRPLLAGIPRHLPALLRAERIGTTVARVGFDWAKSEDSKAKVDEELVELLQSLKAGDAVGVQEEFGDLLFALVNWGRHLGLEPERALREACDKFQSRFAHVEQCVKQEHGDWPIDERGRPGPGIGLTELDAHWNEAKRNTSRPTQQ